MLSRLMNNSITLRGVKKTLSYQLPQAFSTRPEPQMAATLTQVKLLPSSLFFSLLSSFLILFLSQKIGTRRIFEHEHDMYRELCRKFYVEHVTPYHNEWEKNGEVSRECWLEAGRQGILSLSYLSCLSFLIILFI